MSTHYDNALHMMESFGGSFVKALAHCYYMADSDNRKKLHDAFPEEFDRYQRHFEEWKRSQKQTADAGQEFGPYDEDDDISNLMGG